MFRAIVAGGASLITGGALSTICDCDAAGEAPDAGADVSCNFATVTFQSECGIKSVTTTCGALFHATLAA
jgi:hypothetical protein